MKRRKHAIMGSLLALCALAACGAADEPIGDSLGGGPARGRDLVSPQPDAGAGSSSSSGGAVPVLQQLASQGSHTCALWSDGVVKCWGQNNFGQLGYGDTEHRGDEAGEMGAALPEVQLGTNQRAQRIATGILFSCALLESGQIKCWGGGPSFCGSENNEPCGIGYGDNLARGDEPGEMGDALPTIDLGQGLKAIDLDCGAASCCALLSDRSVKCWGDNTNGVLGYGDTMTRGAQPGQMGDALPRVDLGASNARLVRVGTSLLGQHACAVLEGGELKCWGNNSAGQLGLFNTETRGDTQDEMGTALPVVATGGRVRLVAPGSRHTCVLLENGRVRCWGDNNGGTLGLGDTNRRGHADGSSLPLVDVDTRAVRHISSNQHTCVVLEDGKVKCWGPHNLSDDPTSSVLGYGELEDRGDEPNEMGAALPDVDLGPGLRAHSVVTGMYHTCALLINGKVKCWGASRFGSLGYGDNRGRGGVSGSMGAALPFVDLGR